MPDQSETSWPVVIIGLMLVLIFGSLTAAPAIIQLHTAYRIVDARERYRSATGIVDRSEVITTYSGKNRSPGYNPSIHYHYSVDGRDYAGSRYQFGTWTSNDATSGASDIVARYPKGSAVTVMYDPQSPGNSAIDLEWPSDYWLIWMLIQPFLGISILIWIAPFYLVWDAKRNARWLSGRWTQGCAIPRLGTITATKQGLTVGGGLRRLGAGGYFMFGYIVGVYLLLLLLGIFGGRGEGAWVRQPAKVGAAFAIAIALGALWTYRNRTKLYAPRISIDDFSRRIEISTPTRQLDAPWSEHRGWQVRPRLAAGKNSKTLFGLLLISSSRGDFMVQEWESRAVAEHAAGELAKAMGLVVVPHGNADSTHA